MALKRELFFRILGPLEVRNTGGHTAVNGAVQRTVLGLLLLNANQQVPESRLRSAVWPGEEPTTWRKVLRNAVSGLRSLPLGPEEPERRPVFAWSRTGVSVRVDADLLDSTRFHDLADRGRALLAEGDWAGAGRVLGEADDLWSGTVLADLPETAGRWPEAGALSEARTAALVDWATAELLVGRAHSVIRRLHPLLLEDPAREALAGRLVLALYLSGRQAEAVTAYRRTSTAVAGRGGRVGSWTQDLLRRILAHDPVLHDALATVLTPPRSAA